MFLTEDEARKKWCPHVRASEGEHDNNAANCGTTEASRSPIYAKCIASDCSQWRRARMVITQEPTDKGYCGIAGRPAGNPL